MMNINQIISPDRVICLTEISSKKKLLEKLSEKNAAGMVIDETSAK